jgi:hypothetical protein
LVSVAEWRKRILICLGARSSVTTRFLSKQDILGQFGYHLDENAEVALASLVTDRLVFRYPAEHSYNDSYVINPTKIAEIITIITEELEERPELSLPYEPDFDGFSFSFRSEGDTKKNPSRYLYYKKNNNVPHFKVLIQNSSHTKSRKIDMGPLDDPDSKLSRIWAIIDKTITTTMFNKKDVEKTDPSTRGNNGQPLKTGFDILEKLGYIQRVQIGSKCMYQKTQHKPTFYTLDNLFEK